jgi:hypothetical protein
VHSNFAVIKTAMDIQDNWCDSVLKFINIAIQGVPELAPQRKKGALGRIY